MPEVPALKCTPVGSVPVSVTVATGLPVVPIPKVNGLPTLAVAEAAEVKAGLVAFIEGVTVIVWVALVADPAGLVALTWNVKLVMPVNGTVPVMTPAPVMCSHVGALTKVKVETGLPLAEAEAL